MKIRLSVCIATFNRASLIGETLKSVVSQLTQSTELLIVDGASTDGTEQVVREFIKGDDRIRYHKLATNSGVDRDFNTAVELARGDYCWLMSDDDLLKSGAIAAVLDAVEREPSLVVINAETRTPDLASVLKPSMLEIADDETYWPSDAEAFFVRTGQYLSFIGCVVIRKAMWMEREREPYFGSLFIHVGVIFQRPLPGPAVVLADPFIVIRYGNAMWTPRSLEIWMFKWPGLVWSFSGYSDTAKNAVYRQFPYMRFSTLALFRAKGALSRDNYRRMIAPRIRSPLRRWAGYALATTPAIVVNSALAMLLSLRSRREEMPLFELKASRRLYARTFRPRFLGAGAGVTRRDRRSGVARDL